MKETRLIMGMPIEIEIPTADIDTIKVINESFSYLTTVEDKFSVYKETSEISRINRVELPLTLASEEMKEVLAVASKAKRETDGYFDILRPDGRLDPSGVVKGWAIRNVASLIYSRGCENYMVNAGGDIATLGKNADGGDWSVGIRNPFNIQEIVKVVYPRGKGVATSGSYIRGAHIYNPLRAKDELKEIVSITVIGPDVLEADLLATATFAMGKDGISFLERQYAFEGYAIDKNGVATMTSGFESYTLAW